MAVNLYEAMFVVDAVKGGSGFPEVIQHIAGLLTRHGAEIERIEKWDERKLAYPINKAKRGIYILAYFHADGAVISEMRRSVRLSEELLRVLILRTEKPAAVKGTLFSPDGQELEPREEQPTAAPAAEAEPEGGSAQQHDEHQERPQAKETETVQQET